MTGPATSVNDIGILEPLWFPDRSMGNVEREEDTIDLLPLCENVNTR